MSLKPPTEKQLEAIRLEAGFDEETIRKNAEEVLEWLKEQPHLPCGHDLKRLELLFLHCKGSQSKMKESLDVYYSMKNRVKEILTDRDSDGQWFNEIKDIFFYFPLPELTDDLCRITVIGLLDPCLSKHNTNHILKLSQMIQDVRYLNEFCPWDVFIIDLKGASVAHVLRYPLSLLKLILEFGLIGYRVRFKSGHFVNAPVYLDILLTLVKLILKPKLFKRLHVHRNGLGNLYDFIPQPLLPTEYGGNAGSILELWKKWLSTVEQHRDWFLQQEMMRTDESRRPKKKKR